MKDCQRMPSPSQPEITIPSQGQTTRIGCGMLSPGESQTNPLNLLEHSYLLGKNNSNILKLIRVFDLERPILIYDVLWFSCFCFLADGLKINPPWPPPRTRPSGDPSVASDGQRTILTRNAGRKPGRQASVQRDIQPGRLTGRFETENNIFGLL